MTGQLEDEDVLIAGVRDSAPLVEEADHIGDVLLTYQKEGWKLLSTTAVLVAEKSRRIGYTWWVAAYCALDASKKRTAGGQDTLYMGTEKEMTREFIDACAMFAKAFHMAASKIEETVLNYVDDDGETKEVKAFRIDFASGYKILALTSNPRAFRGRQGNVVLDEAALHDNLDAVLTAAFALTMHGGKIIIISTHLGDDNPFNELIEEIRAGRREDAIVHRVTFDEAIEDGLYERLALIKGWEKTLEARERWIRKTRNIYIGRDAQELDVIPQASAGAVLSLAIIKKCSRPDIPVIQWETPKGFLDISDRDRKDYTEAWLKDVIDPVMAERLVREWISYFGQDFGRVYDLSIIWPLQVADNLKRYTPFVLELAGCPFETQKQILFHIVKRLPRFGGGAMDKGGNGAYLAEVAGLEFGSDMVEGIQFSEGWYRDNMSRLVADLEDDNFTLPKDRDTQNDFRMLRRVRGVIRVPDARVDAAQAGAKRHGDSVIAAALADFAAERRPYVYEFESLNNNRQVGADLGHDMGDDDGPAGGFIGLGGGLGLSGF